MRKILLLAAFLIISKAAFAKPHENTWWPDTCNGCAVVYEFDDELPAEDRVISFKKIEKEDPPHAGKTPQAQYDAILEENQRKNKAIGEIMKSHSDLVVIKDGSDTFKDGVSVEFSYDELRKLHLKVNGVNNGKKNEIQQSVDQKLGSGKVQIE